MRIRTPQPESMVDNGDDDYGSDDDNSFDDGDWDTPD